jgi:hypothetical protein
MNLVLLLPDLQMQHTAPTERFVQEAQNILPTDYVQGGRSGVRFQAVAINFSLLLKIQTGSGSQTASHTIGDRGCFPTGIAAGA